MMTNRNGGPRRRPLVRVAVALAAGAFAIAVGPGIGRIAVVVLLLASWIALIVLVRSEEARGRSLGMWTYIWLFGLALGGMIVFLLRAP